MSTGLIVFLHGVGSQGASFSSLAAQWAEELPAAAFAAPDAPFVFDLAPNGRQWFSVKGVTENNRAERIVAARQAFDELLHTSIADAGFQDRLEQVVLVGFSQGSIMALDAVVSGRWPVAGVVAFSGRLASPLPYIPCLKTPVLLVHGDADGVMPVEEAVRASQNLSGAGVSVVCDILPGVGHTVSAAGAGRALEFVKACLFSSSATP